METNLNIRESSFLRPNETIAINPSKGKITLATRRLFNILLYCAQHDGDKPTYSRPISELMQMMTTTKDTEWFKNCFRQMRDTPIEWNSKEGSIEDWRTSGLITEARVVRAGGSTTISWSLPSVIRERLKDPRFYTKLTLEMHSKLTTGASIALYEICLRYLTNPTKVTNREPWQWWQPRLTGNAKRETSEYKYFARDTLRPAIAEVNEISEINVELIEHKIGRRIEEIQFRVTKKVSVADTNKLDSKIDAAVLESIMSFGIAQGEARNLYFSHEIAFLRKTILLVENRMLDVKAPTLTSPAAFFKNALKKEYANAPSARMPVPKAAASLETAEDVRTPEEKRASVLGRLTAKRINDAHMMWSEQNADIQLKLLSEFATESAIDSYIKDVKRRGLACMVSTAIRTGFCDWYALKTWGPISEKETIEFMLANG